MNDVLFVVDGSEFVALDLRGTERLGEASRFEVTFISPHVLPPESVLGKPAAVTVRGEFGDRTIHGLVTGSTAIATSQSGEARTCRVVLESALALLRWRRRSRIHQHLSVPDIIRRVFQEAGFAADTVSAELVEEHPPRDYVVQYAETDATFVRRLCEEEGLYFRFEARDGVDAFVLEDASAHAPATSPEKLLLVDESALGTTEETAFACESARRRRPGKVRLRDYDPAKPSLLLEALVEAGTDVEKRTEVYRAPGGFTTPEEGETRARVVNESLRADVKQIHFETSAPGIAPGHVVQLEPAHDYPGTARPEGKFFVVAVEHVWASASPRRTCKVTAIPAGTPYRLPLVTPRPTIHGVQSAIVTGAPGEEIHTDAGARSTVHFHWDREQPADDKSSLPIRTMQPNLPGSMLLPRVGWEAIVAFEGGDPNRPVIVGRTYNAKHPPPFALPANKTITALATVSSPGGGRRNSIHMDDAAGRQHMAWAAGFGKTTTVAANMLTQTVGFEALAVNGSQTWSVGGNESVSVGNAMLVKVGSQTGTVGGSQSILIKAAGGAKVGSESVAVGGALLEQVGNPATGAANFAEAAALAGVSEIPVVGTALSKGYGLGKALGEGYAEGGVKGLLNAAGQQAVNLAAEQIPGGDALSAAADGAGLTPWSDKAQQAAGSAEAGGGTGGPGGAGAGAAQAAPGHRKTIVDGAVAESIGAAYTVTTPGPIKWTTLGPSTFAVGGSHSTRAVKVNRVTGGASSDTSATLDIKTALAIGRSVKGALKTTIAGSLTSTASGKHDIKAGGPLTIQVGGSLDLEGAAVVFKVGSSIVAAHSGGVLFKASKITVNGKSVQSGKATNKQ